MELSALTLQINGRGEDGGCVPVYLLRSGGHYGAGGCVGPVVRVGMRVGGVMGPQRRGAPSARGSRVGRITSGPRSRVPIGGLAHLRARAQVTVSTLHLTCGQSTAGRLETGRRRGSRLVQVRIIHASSLEDEPSIR